VAHRAEPLAESYVAEVSASFEQRMVFGASQAYVKQMRVGQTWHELKPVYALAIINGTIPAASGIAADGYYHHYRIVNVEEPKQMLAGLEFVFIELPKFRPEGRGEKRLQTLWLRFLREVGAAPSQVIDAEMLQDHDIAQALGLVEQGAFTEAELAGYHNALDQTTTYISMLADAEAKGEARGEAKGERAKALAIASALLADALSPERVAAATGLSIEELRALQGVVRKSSTQ
jgi:predicted transposase/invertase (TIGR01784 family)